MKIDELPYIQSRRFDFEELGEPINQVIQHADDGPVFIRKDKQVSYVVLTEELFNRIWPDVQRVFSVAELPKRLGDLLDKGIESTLSNQTEQR